MINEYILIIINGINIGKNTIKYDTNNNPDNLSMNSNININIKNGINIIHNILIIIILSINLER